jgi:hypothetical protein
MLILPHYMFNMKYSSSDSKSSYLTVWNISLLEKLTVAQLVENSPFYGTRMHITEFTKTRHFEALAIFHLRLYHSPDLTYKMLRITVFRRLTQYRFSDKKMKSAGTVGLMMQISSAYWILQNSLLAFVFYLRTETKSASKRSNFYNF